uniref:Uncharacterized protein n=1 Tax=Chromera velia CCMP2878 TaxID=1169474 RepID=A0A0G4HZW7_9ALVE|eukprot:Cvel_9823.t1-p1 / transcript=Cvel_9823.t1 / gene=Cvel_9823 / organism=Chromera_velia_CCMP2878 / gene_product=hypothetical protein / transcript_product=hypothetical protein / location=Cvel_scaffold577:8444-17922(-) / protein_length=226 / sequence_SO=supercontig / SO=protein_coding / is_pseudo=false
MHSDGGLDVPIETRALFHPNDTHSGGEATAMPRGTLKCWVELMTPDTAARTALHVLPSPDPEAFQIRLVIWRVGLWVAGFVFDIQIPSAFPTLKLQLWEANLLSDESLGECTLDLQQDYSKAKRTRKKQKLRSWVSCSHPKFPGKSRGLVDLELHILTQAEALFDPVGKAREEPNKDPHLETVTENRSRMEGNQFVESGLVKLKDPMNELTAQMEKREVSGDTRSD